MAWLHRAAKRDITIIKSASSDSSQCHHMPLYDWYVIDVLSFCFVLTGVSADLHVQMGVYNSWIGIWNGTVCK